MGFHAYKFQDSISSERGGKKGPEQETRQARSWVEAIVPQEGFQD